MNDRLAHYEVREKIGQGGMGAVFLARDTRLQRDVALKVLPEAFLQDGERLARFEREAQLLAQLSHPHVAQVHGFEEADQQKFLVMEYVPGEDLAARILRGRIPVDEAIRIARQIAEALEAAHEAGIVHRDLKPSNIRLTPDDGAKVLDFGLAKALEGDPAQSGTGLSMSPTITGMMTSANVILGTAAYMSPEQARGKRVDRRADIWAFGAVLYEMLTGRQAFPGETVSDVLAAVLKTEPDRDALPNDAPAALRRLVDRCLEKDPRHRLRDIGEARILLSGPLDEAPAFPAAPEPDRGRRLPWILAVALTGVAAAAAGWFLKPAPDRSTLAYELAVPDSYGMYWADVAVSPDGKWIAFSSSDSAGNPALFVRAQDASEMRRLEGAAGGFQPFWSPDSKQLGYWDTASRRLYRVAVEGGAPVPICPAPNMRGGTWGEDGTIVFAPESSGPLFRVPAMGGTPEPMASADTMVSGSHRWPWFLPGGDRFLYLDAFGTGDPRLMVGTVNASGPAREVLPLGGSASYDRGHLFFVRDGILHAQEFDPAGLALGEVHVVANGVFENPYTFRSSFSVGGGVVAYIDAPVEEVKTAAVLEFDASGKEVKQYTFSGEIEDLAVTSDGGRLAAMVRDQTKVDIWALDTERDVKTRVSFDGSSDDPVFSPDGREMVYASSGNLVRRAVDAAAQARTILEDDRGKVPHQWTRDDEIIYCTGGNTETLCRLDLKTGEDAVLRDGAYRYMLGQVSPDGKWIAYVCMETGDREVYVEDYPGLTTRVRISRDRGTFPRWARGGSRLWYLDGEYVIREVTLAAGNGGIRVTADEPRFRASGANWGNRTHQIGVSEDGSRIFVMYGPEIGAVASHVRVIRGWRGAG